MFKLKFTPVSAKDYKELEINPSSKKIFNSVKKVLGYLSINTRHPSLNSHKYNSLTGPDGQEVFEVYAQNNTPGAYRIFWCYEPGKEYITIIAITPHP